MLRAKALILLLASLPFVTTACAVAETSQSAATRMIERAGHKIAFHVTPGKLPAIVLDAGGGEDASHWDSLVPELAKRTGAMIITYDRAGFGASDEVPGPWSPQSATDDLAAGLKALDATKGVILVAHSLAGQIATYLTQQHPDWFTGVVLVDASVPDFYTDDVIAKTMALYEPKIAAIKASPPSKPGRQLLALSESFVETSKAFHKAAWPAKVPAIVIVSEQTPFDDAVGAKLWRDAQAQFAAGASNRSLVVAERSSHDVSHDRPDLIIRAVTDLQGR